MNERIFIRSTDCRVVPPRNDIYGFKVMIQGAFATIIPWQRTFRESYHSDIGAFPVHEMNGLLGVVPMDDRNFVMGIFLNMRMVIVLVNEMKKASRS